MTNNAYLHIIVFSWFGTFFRAAVANADTGSLKSLHALFDTYLNHMLAKYEPNRMVQNVKYFEFFDKKPSFEKQLF